MSTKSDKVLISYIVETMKFAAICSKVERLASQEFDFDLATSAADFGATASAKLGALTRMKSSDCGQRAKEQLAKSSDSAENSQKYKDLEEARLLLLRDLGRANDRVDDLVGSVCVLKAENERLGGRLKEVEANFEASCREALENDDQRSVDKSVEVVRLPAKATPKVKKSRQPRKVNFTDKQKASLRAAEKADEAKADNGKPSVEELRQIFPGVADGCLDWAWAKKCDLALQNSGDFSSLEID